MESILRSSDRFLAMEKVSEDERQDKWHVLV